jgi:hypothetical protein
MEVKKNETVYTVLRSVSRSGMTRHIDCYIIRENKPYCINYEVEEVTKRRRSKDGSIVVGGCGMDMGFALVYAFSYALWPKGYECSGQDCHSNDHFNGDKNYTPHHHSDGGYCLKQEWM